jgi:hypothetical protein
MFGGSRHSLLLWFYLVYRVSTDSMPVNAARIALELRLPYRTVWNLVHKIRRGLAEEDCVLELCARTLRAHKKRVQKRNARFWPGALLSQNVSRVRSPRVLEMVRRFREINEEARRYRAEKGISGPE